MLEGKAVLWKAGRAAPEASLDRALPAAAAGRCMPYKHGESVRLRGYCKGADMRLTFSCCLRSSLRAAEGNAMVLGISF